MVRFSFNGNEKYDNHNKIDYRAAIVGSLIMIEIITGNKMVFIKYWASRFV
jgi:hypothetical protein